MGGIFSKDPNAELGGSLQGQPSLEQMLHDQRHALPFDLSIETPGGAARQLQREAGSRAGVHLHAQAAHELLVPPRSVLLLLEQRYDLCA